MRRAALPLLLLTALLAAPPVLAAELFDRPLAVQSVPPASADDPGGAIRCTYYRDFMVRETGTDSPAPGPAAVIAVVDAARRPPCSAAPAAREVALKTEDFALRGRKGPFLVFEAADPNGAMPFSVVEAGSGRIVYSDSEIPPDGLHAVVLAGGVLHIRYTRAFNGSCSVLKDAAGCWAKLAREGNFPPQLAQSPPPVKMCAAAYRREDVPSDDPSMITYDVDVALEVSGKSEVKFVGNAGCAPMP